MAKLFRILTLALATVGLVSSPNTALAQSAADSAADQARANTGGRVLSVRPSNDPRTPGYEVKVLLANGTVRVMYINPK